MTLADLPAVDLDTDPPGYRPDGKAAPRWQPDLQLVPAMLVVPRWPKRLTEYEEPDRCWIVAGLTLADWSAEEIVHRIGGSIRLIRDIRSKPMTSLCTLMHEEMEKLTKELRLSEIDRAATEHELAQTTREAERLRLQRDQVIEKRKAGKPVDVFPCGHSKSSWNLYRQTGTRSNGRKFTRECCRECANTRASQYRARHKTAG